MADLPLTLLTAVSVTFLVFEISTGMVISHTDVPLPKAAMYGHQSDRKVGRSAYIVEVPVVAFVVGGGSLILLLMVVHPDSTIPVRLVAAAAVVASGAWLAYLARRLFQRR